MNAKITTLDKATCKVLAAEFEKAMKEVAARFGVEVRVGNGRFDVSTFSFKTEVKTANAPTQDEQLAMAFRSLAGIERLSLDLGWLGRTICHKGEFFTVVGYSCKSPKRPIVLRRNCDQKTFRANVDAVRRAFLLSA